MDQSEFQISQLPDTSLDDSPFLNLKNSRVRKKKTQTKLTYLKQVSSKRKKSDAPKTSEVEKNSHSETKSKSSHSETKSKENSLQTLLGETPCSDNAMSVNTSGKEEKKTICACPVCWKHFENSGDQMQHMKMCASKHNLTLKQLLDAVDLQTKQMEERKILGLPFVPPTNAVRKNASKKSSSAGDKDDPDLQLGLALSVSMKESEEQNHLVEQEIMLEAGLGDEVAANQASLLERFGFTSTRPILPSIYPRARPGKTKLKGTPLLLIRTQDERERLVTEKVAIILTSDENEFTPQTGGNHVLSVKNHLESETLAKLQNEECCLWQKASSSPGPKDCEIYYVKSLSYIISPSTIKAGSKLKHLSQVPCRLKTPRELQKYGLKPLKRKRAKQILRHIYNELHPLVSVQSNDNRSDPINVAEDGILRLSSTAKQVDDIRSPKMRRGMKEIEMRSEVKKDGAAAVNSSEEGEISSEDEVAFASTQESSSSSLCQFEVLEDPTEDDIVTQIDVSELPGVVYNYIKSNPKFYQQVLLYEPIWLEQLQDGLKAQNYKFKLTQLMEYLDEECITFRTTQGNRSNKRQKKKKSK